MGATHRPVGRDGLTSSGDGGSGKGLLYAIVGGIVIFLVGWALTSWPGSPFTNPRPVILDFTPSVPAVVGDEAKAAFRVQNTGDEAAVGCKGFWTVDVRPGLNGERFYVVELSPFGLAKGETRDGSLTGRPYPAQGDFKMSLQVECGDHFSETVDTTVSVQAG